MLLVDTGVLLAAADDADPDHGRCAAARGGQGDPLVTTALVVAETGYLIDRQLGPVAEAAFYRSIAAGDLRIETLTERDWSRISELVEQYSDLPLGGTDASLLAVSEKLGLTTLATLDRRHFNVVRPVHVRALELVPSGVTVRLHGAHDGVPPDCVSPCRSTRCSGDPKEVVERRVYRVTV